MKKLLLSLLLFSLISFDTYGESYTIPLSYLVSPTYIVSVPKSIDVSNNETSFSFSVSGDIYYDYQLEVKFASNTTITSGNYSSIINVNQDKTLFNCDDLFNKSYGNVYLSHDYLHSGTWSGELNLLITLKEGACSQ